LAIKIQYAIFWLTISGVDMLKEKLNSPLKKMLNINMFKRRLFFIVADSLIIGGAVYFSFWLRFDGSIPAPYLQNLKFYIGFALAVMLTMLLVHGMYSISWRFFGLKDLIKLLSAITISSLLMGLSFFLFRAYLHISGFPRSVILVDYLLSLGSISVLRISKRAFIEYLSKAGRMRHRRARILIVGAGEAGSAIGREMLINENSKYFPIGYIDDDLSKRGMSIQGIKVLGMRDDIPTLLKANAVDEVLIAIPSFRSKDIRAVVEIIRNSGGPAKVKILPGLLDLMVEDLLGREKVEIDFAAIGAFLNRKRVLITGAGGSVGSELVRTALTFEPSLTALLDIDETELFYLMNRFRRTEKDIIPVVGDIRDPVKMEAVFAKFRPEIVLHSAAYKHVPVMEDFPEEAVKTNILGTRILGDMALKYQVEKFVYISTDKAINPTSVMGSTKRVGEEILRVLNRRNGTKYISVRFGNVLGSRGSVIPLFEEQIKRGGPVTVTHPEVKRYFMATSEAVLLVLQAAATGEGGEAYILDMGEPVKVLDLAREMIRLSGYTPDVDIPIVFSGLRPGEKLFEELLGAEEGSEPTEHPRIFKARNPSVREDAEILPKVESLINMCYNGYSRDGIIDGLMDIVPTYRPQSVGNGNKPAA
jgi:FlaA1/EpsC-like NDP-sugar epimerase